MEDSEKVVSASGGHDTGQGRDGQGRQRPPFHSRLVDHLDEVGAGGGPIGDEGLRPLRIVQGRQRDAELRAVPASHGHAPAREHVGSLRNRARGLLPAPLGSHVLTGEHVENGGDAEVQRLLERRSEVVRMAVDQPRQQGHAGAVDDLRVGASGSRNVGVQSDRFDHAAADQDGRLFKHFVAGEHARALDDRGGRLGQEPAGRPGQAGEQDQAR